VRPPRPAERRDAGSARIIEHAGAKAIATSSAAVAWSHGYPDGQAIPREALLATVREIVRVVGVPVSADVEAGYAPDADAAGAFAARVVEAGAVGVIVEHGTGAPDLLAAKIERMKTAAAKAGGALRVNARVDVYLRRLAEGPAAYDETPARARREAGARPDPLDDGALRNPEPNGLMRRERARAPPRYLAVK
jgi:2-methylisocitrate lyase-like PEP mutase family enzyme